MSAANGGKGTPPVPPESHMPDPPQREPRQIIEYPVATSASRIEGSRPLMLTLVVIEQGEPVKRTFLVGEQGRKQIQEAVNGGIEVATADAVPPPEKP